MQDGGEMGKCESGTIGAGLHPGQGPTLTFVARLRGIFSFHNSVLSRYQLVAYSGFCHCY